jgi:hypothetical protein
MHLPSGFRSKARHPKSTITTGQKSPAPVTGSWKFGPIEVDESPYQKDRNAIEIAYPPLMRPKLRRNIFILSLIFAVPALWVLLNFDGDLDFGGHYEVLQTVPYPNGKIAFEIERWDNQALSGNRYAVIVDDHVPSTFELRRALISFWQRRSFELADQRVSIIWSGPNQLTLSTDAPDTSPDWLVNQSHRIGDVVVKYAGRP